MFEELKKHLKKDDDEELYNEKIEICFDHIIEDIIPTDAYA